MCLLFPGYCFSCRRIGKYLCSRCVKKLKTCRRRKIVVDKIKVHSYFSYSFVFKKTLQGAKYYSVKSVLYELFALYPLSDVRKYVSTLVDPVFIPVPMFSSKRKSRGFNQAELFAQFLSKKTRVPVVRDLVVKVRSTPAQAHLSREEREINMKNVFICKPAQRKYHCVIVDDVYTTGSTVRSLISEMKACGFSAFTVITLARSE